MVNNYFRKNRQFLLPRVKNWFDPQDHIRLSNNVKRLSYSDWFFCHPSSYVLFYYSFVVLPLFFCVIGSFWCLHLKSEFWFLFVFLMGILGFELTKRIRHYKNIKNTTFYDLLMREYK